MTTGARQDSNKIGVVERLCASILASLSTSVREPQLKSQHEVRPAALDGVGRA